MEVDAADDITLGGPELQVPTKAELTHDPIVRAAVNDLHERPFLLRVKVRRVDHPLLRIAIIGAFEGHALDLAEVPLSRKSVVEVLEGNRLWDPWPVREGPGRPVEAVAQENAQASAASEVDRPFGQFRVVRERLFAVQPGEEDVHIARVLGLEGDPLAVGQPLEVLAATVKALCQLSRLVCLA